MDLVATMVITTVTVDATNHVANAIANTFIMRHVLIQQLVVSKNKSHTHADAAVMYLSTTKFRNAVMFRNIIAKHNADKFLNIMMFKSAELAQELFANHNADMYHVTTGNVSATTHALQLAHLAATKS